MSPQDAKTRLYKHGLISIVRGNFSLQEILQMSEALLRSGVNLVEITLNSAHVFEGIREVQKQLGDDMLVGAGTVRTADDVKKAVDAGAGYLIAPNLDLAAVLEAQRQETLLIPGVFTASEAQAAHAAGCGTVKLFPADALGPPYLKALRAPLDHIDFVPSGGVNDRTIADFHRAGAVAYGVGSALVKNVEVTDAELAALGERARVLCGALEEARGGVHNDVQGLLK